MKIALGRLCPICRMDGEASAWTKWQKPAVGGVEASTFWRACRRVGEGRGDDDKSGRSVGIALGRGVVRALASAYFDRFPSVRWENATISAAENPRLLTGTGHGLSDLPVFRQWAGRPLKKPGKRLYEA